MMARATGLSVVLADLKPSSCSTPETRGKVGQLDLDTASVSEMSWQSGVSGKLGRTVQVAI